LVFVDANNLIAYFSKASSCNETDITRTNNAYFHEIDLKMESI